MKNHKYVTFIQYETMKRTMLNDLGCINGICKGVACNECPLYHPNRPNTSADVDCNQLEYDYPEKALEIVMGYIPKAERVDWSKVSVDTKILVRDYDNQEWEPKHFAKYADGKVYVWGDGHTSFTARGNTVAWSHAKLYKECEK